MKNRLKASILLFIIASAVLNAKAANKEDIVIGFSQCTSGDSWRRSMQESMEQEVLASDGLELIIEDANNDSQLQIEQIKLLLAKDIDLLIVSPNEVEPITAIVEEAYYQGIPVIIVDRRINSDLYTAYVGADNYQIGISAGNYIDQVLNGAGKILEIWGLRGSSPAINRHSGFRAMIDTSNIDVVAEVDGKWEKQFVEELLPDALAQHNDIDLIYAHNDRMALGAYLVCKKLGLENQIKIVGIDGLAGANGGLQLVESGLLDATFLYPTGGEEVIELAKRILNNEPFQKENILETTLINRENVGVVKSQSDKILQLRQELERQRVAVRSLERSRTSKNGFIIGLALTIIGVGLLLFLLQRKLVETRRRNQELTERNAQLLVQQQNVLDSISKKKVPKASPSKDFVTRFKALVDANLSNADLQIQDICKTLGVSRIQLYRKVKANLNCSASDYIQNERLKKAKKLLETTDMPIGEIAYEVGYTSPSYFSTAFKAKFNQSPTEYKQSV